MEVEGLVIEEFSSFGISGDEDLKAAVEKEAVDQVGADATADGVGGFEEEEGDVGGVEVGGGGEAGEAGSDDGDSGFGREWSEGRSSRVKCEARRRRGGGGVEKRSGDGESHWLGLAWLLFSLGGHGGSG